MKTLIWIVAISLLRIPLFGQEFQFNQFTTTALFINPALTGKMNEDLRLLAIHRSQWRSTNVPFYTTGAMADVNFYQVGTFDKIGIGTTFLRDELGENGIFVNNAFMFSTALQKILDMRRRHSLSFGIQGGMWYKNMPNTNFYFANQIDNNFQPNFSIASNENLSTFRYQYFNLNAGLFWEFVVNDKVDIFLGTSGFNLTQPRESFLGHHNRLPRLWMLHPGVVYNFTPQFYVEPQALLAFQGSATIYNLGVQTKYNLYSSDEEHNTHITLGSWYRGYGAAVIQSGLGYDNYRLQFSYEITTNPTLRNINRNVVGQKNAIVGAFEISLMYLGFLPWRAVPNTMTLPSRIF
ncbi:MAG: type IX secretion system membrane protein PorP/SprF [Cytophagales bacterium]|nr:type IX secretion system membrane protein PorP/SprF [Cytophagales bacterium]MDW8384811.1 PorP/SprF family type IX secretion system membrane protein [Flammeovirgaceae bacterium]